ncbi:MAG TPA: POTRA domain-containing protein, partial [Pirellulales bacterium]|nr:POTRA domain-containing protein [Pirellulales bacterium]
MAGGYWSFRGLARAVAINVAMWSCATAWGQSSYKGEPRAIPPKPVIEPDLPQQTPLPGNVGPLQSAPITQGATPPRSSPLPPRIQPGSDVPTINDTIVDVRVVGNQAVNLQRITPHVKTRAGRPFDSEIIEEDVRRLVKSRMFVTVDTKYQRTPEGGLIVIFQVVERPTLRYVKYVGNTVKKRHLDKQTNLKPGDSADPYMVTEAKRKLEEYYSGKGYGKVRVTIMEGDKAGDRGAVFVINEGQKQRVWQVKFEGNTVASDSRLKTQVKTKIPLL